MIPEKKSLMNDVEQSMKLPRDNGELVFKTPWEGRIFAMAVLLYEKGLYPWQAFNGQFVQEIDKAERQHPETDVATTYYQHWVKAFEKLLIEKQMLTPEQLNMRADEFESGKRHHVC